MTAPKIYKPHKNYKEGNKAIVHSSKHALDYTVSVCVRAFTFFVPLLHGNIWIILTDTFIVLFRFITDTAKCSNSFLLLVTYCHPHPSPLNPTPHHSPLTTHPPPLTTYPHFSPLSPHLSHLTPHPSPPTTPPHCPPLTPTPEIDLPCLFRVLIKD